MSATNEPQYLLLWKGIQSGPFTLALIREKLGACEISRMHQVNQNGRWIVLDEFLEKQGGDLDARRRAEAEKREKQMRHEFESQLAAERARKTALELRLANAQQDLKPQSPPPQHVAAKMEPPVASTATLVSKHGTEVTGKAMTFARRIIASNFTVEAALPEERAALERANMPVTSPVAQNYAAWRRAMLWFSGFGLTVAMAVNIVDEVKSGFGSDNLPIVRVILIGLLLVKIITPALLIHAALKWTDIRASRQAARRAVFLTFFGPLLIFLLPVTGLSSPQELRNHGIQTADQLMGISTIVGVSALLTLLPHFLGLFPGIIRACMTLRTLVPESPLPGTIIALILPLFAILLLIALALVAQAGRGILFLGVAGMLCLPVFLFWNIRLLLKPMDGITMNAKIGPLRKSASLAWDIGLLLIVADLYQIWKGWGLRLDLSTVIASLCNLIGVIILVTLAGTDFLLGLMKFTFDQDKELHDTQLYRDMDARFKDLDQARMTQNTE